MSQRRKFTQSSWFYALLTMVVVVYMAMMWIVGGLMSREQMCKGMVISVDTTAVKFLNPQGMAAQMGDYPWRVSKMPLRKVNIDSLERMLAGMDEIESVSVTIQSDRKVHVDIVPMHPVARVFDSRGRSYYINKQGKRITADARFHIDVPLVIGDFNDTLFNATAILPLVDYMKRDELWSNMISMVRVDSPEDIVLVPVIRGHVINIGDTTDYPGKFSRLRRFYKEVMDVRGWEMYDNISVKYAGQVVATRRNKHLQEPEAIVETTNSEAAEIDLTPSDSLTTTNGASPAKNI